MVNVKMRFTSFRRICKHSVQSGSEVITEFNKKISTVRSRSINLIPIFQNIGQIKAVILMMFGKR